MNTNTVIDNIKTELSALSWASTDGGGTTSLQEVFTYRNYEHEEGYPFACIYDGPGNGELNTVITYEFDTIFTIDFCVNWSVIDESEEQLQREEAMLRLREMWDYMKTQIFTRTFLTAVGVDLINEPNFISVSLDDLNIECYRVQLLIKEII